MFRAHLMTGVSHLFLVLNSSTNIIVYCWKDDKFRLVLYRMLKLYRPMDMNYSHSIGSIPLRDIERRWGIDTDEIDMKYFRTQLTGLPRSPSNVGKIMRVSVCKQTKAVTTVNPLPLMNDTTV